MYQFPVLVVVSIFTIVNLCLKIFAFLCESDLSKGQGLAQEARYCPMHKQEWM